MGSFSHNCEIVEVKEELNSVQHSIKVKSTSVFRENDRNQKPLQNLGCSDSLEGLNKPFPVINLKHSYNLSPPQQVDSNPSRKNAQKMPITAESPHSLGMGVSDTVTLKQALRGLCITQASEMAAMKRLSKPPGISGVSDNLKNGHKSVLDEPFDDGLSLGEGRKNKVKISPLPEKSIPNHSKKTPQRLQVTLKTVHNRSAPSSPVATSRLKSLAKMPNVSVHASMDVGSPTLKSVLAEKEKTKLLHPKTALTISKTGSSAPSSPVATSKLKSVAKMSDASVHASIDMGTPTLKSVLVEKGKIKPLHSPSCPKTGATTPKIGNSVSSSPKVPKKASTPGRLQNVSSSSSSTINKNKVKNSTSNTLGLTKLALKNTASVNDKAKQDSASIASTSDEFDGISTELDLSKSHLICQRCQCALKNAKVDSDNESPVSNSPGAEVGTTIVKSDASKPSFTSNKPTKAREKGQFFPSQKGSPGEYSSTTSFCGESALSLPSCGNRPHMSKDERWKAICHVRLRHEVLGLRHFNLLKKLGCGDIGTVYLAELIDSNCLFAIKVMDNAYLERRKKMLRAQTEREIMKILDHPFLPTLYGHFTSDNLSCLVMEFCPGGDLHVLRQRQLGRIFSEQAARFYAAEVLLALEYLHMLGVVYRDLKPENILVREDGHIMLTDFDLSLRCSVSPTLFKSSSSMDPTNTISAPRVGSSCAKPFFVEPSCQVPCFSPRLLTVAARVRKQKSEPAADTLSLPQLVAEPTSARSNSFVGTHEYLAPEIINGEGHGSAVDWWTFGIFLYELLYGRTPFKGPGNEETLANVVLMSLKFPDNPIVSVQARDLIRRLLMKDPGNRLGSQRGTAEIKRHPFFEGLNWALIRCAIPPEIPKDCNFGVPTIGPQQNGSKYLEYRATGDHLEFELF